MVAWILGVIVALGAAGTECAGPIRVEVPLSRRGEIDLGELVDRLARATGVSVARPAGTVELPVAGLSGSLTRTMLTNTLGPGSRVQIEGDRLVVGVEAAGDDPRWPDRLRELAGQAEREMRRRLRYGMRAFPSYRANDPTRPTVCLVHGVNSSSYGFVHMIKPIEEAGYGVVVFDYPFNRSLEESSARFAADWRAFRKQLGETQPWSIVAHSMGALVSRSYVEGPSYGGDVSTLILVAPVNQGSSLAQTQTILQMLKGLQAVGGERPSTDALAHLGDGLGEAATDMTPGSTFLRSINARPRRAGVAYHILAGDLGLITAATRRQIESQVGSAARQSGILSGLVRFATSDLSQRLDEVSDGTGDGCVSVARTRLDGVSDHVTIHANHAELIRAPLLFRDPGPVACMPYLLRWLPRPEPETRK